jgi:hypothetical protein
MPKKNFIPINLRPWIEARKKYHLSHVQIQMARVLGLNPKKFGNLSDNKQQQWKLPLPKFIEKIYFKRFNKKVPENLRSIEQIVKEKAKKKAENKIQKEKAIQSDGSATIS